MPANDSKYKTVLVPVTVPRGKFCRVMDGECMVANCQYLGIFGGGVHASCKLGLGWISMNYDKPLKCSSLKKG
jgi:hypothetical protein